MRGRSKGIGVFSNTQELEFEHASDSRWFRTGLEARESQQRTRSLLAIKCTKNKIENHHTRAQNEERELIQKAQRALGGYEFFAVFPVLLALS